MTKARILTWQWVPMGGIVKVVAALLLTGVQPGYAEPAAKEPDVQQLLLKLEERDRKIAERDALINDLQRRVGQLERRFDAAAPQQAQRAAAPPAAVRPAPQPGTTAKATPKSRRSAPGTFEVDEEAAERALERTLTQVGALLLPYGLAEIQPFVTYARREQGFAGPVIVTNSPPTGLGGTQINVRRDEFTPGLFTRIGLPFNSQFELSIPVRVVDQSIAIDGLVEQSRSTGSSLGDIRVGLAATVLREQGWLPDVVTRVAWDTDSGKRVDNGVNLFQGFNDIIGSVTVLKRQDPLVFTGTFSYQGSLKKDGIEPGDQFGINVGTWLAASPETSLFMELQQVFASKTKINGVSIPGSDLDSSTLVFGASALVAPGVLVSLSAGIGLTENSPDYTVNLAIPIRLDLPMR